MRFNMINWLLETVSLILVMFVENVFLNILVNSCGNLLPPVLLYVNQFFFKVYFLGIEENRKLAREHFMSRIWLFTKNKDKMSSPIQDKET